MSYSKVYTLFELVEFGRKNGYTVASSGETMSSEIYYSLYIDGVRTLYVCDIKEYEDENLVKLLLAFVEAENIKGELYLTK